MKQPTAAEFIDFYIHGGSSHPAYRWLREHQHFISARSRLPASRDHLQFAKRVSGCLGRYFSGRRITDARSRSRAAAAAVYERTLKLCRSGFGPYADDDRLKLEELLQTTRDYLLDKHIGTGFQMKRGEHRSVGFLIRELVVFLDTFDIPSRSLNPTIADLVSIVDDDLSMRTIERHVKEYLNSDRSRKK